MHKREGVFQGLRLLHQQRGPWGAHLLLSLMSVCMQCHFGRSASSTDKTVWPPSTTLLFVRIFGETGLGKAEGTRHNLALQILEIRNAHALMNHVSKMTEKVLLRIPGEASDTS